MPENSAVFHGTPMIDRRLIISLAQKFSFSKKRKALSPVFREIVKCCCSAPSLRGILTRQRAVADRDLCDLIVVCSNRITHFSRSAVTGWSSSTEEHLSAENQDRKSFLSLDKCFRLAVSFEKIQKVLFLNRNDIDRRPFSTPFLDFPLLRLP